MSDFDIKNERRRIAKARSKADFRQGRANRRAFSWHGAFGTEVSRVWNDCALGTSAPQRTVKAGADDYDHGYDYDES